MIDIKTNEELKQKYSPEGSDLRKSQLLLLDMMLWIDDICKRNNINCWISSGTCLGAVRHGGFIPWDDDLDIEMTLDNYQRFEKIVNKMIDCPYKLQSYSSDKHYYHSFSKLRNEKIPVSEFHNEDKFFKYRGLFIDIFIVVPKLTKLVSKIGGYWWYKCRRNVLESNRLVRLLFHYWIFPIGYYLVKPILMFISPKNKKEYSIMFGDGVWNTRKIKNIQTPRPIMFEGHSLMGPNNPDGYLRDIYGDYEELKINQSHFKR